MQVKRMGMLQNRSYGSQTVEPPQGGAGATLVMAVVAGLGVLWLISSSMKGEES